MSWQRAVSNRMHFGWHFLQHEIVNGLGVFDGGGRFGDGRELYPERVRITERFSGPGGK